jgi:hypothetical protein
MTKEIKPKIISFHGSRILDNQKVVDIIEKEINKHNPEYVVTHGEASGVCAMVRDYCRRNGIPLKLHFYQKAKYGKGMYYMRSMAVIEECNYCVFIHDGQSKGTNNELEIAKKLGREYSYHLVEDEGVEDILKVFDEELLTDMFGEGGKEEAKEYYKESKKL